MAFLGGIGLIQPSSCGTFASIYLDTNIGLFVVFVVVVFCTRVPAHVVCISESPCVHTEALIRSLERYTGGPCPPLLYPGEQAVLITVSQHQVKQCQALAQPSVLSLPCQH